ncbi:hypothetical protein ACFV1L_17255 [Kitasatospora sp. NPDC059646]|uniref:hypothetical protein n=1 Tax=Kitasatospora sp. NPDC059646 TaxID=3346893 RepID=UPI0036954401
MPDGFDDHLAQIEHGLDDPRHAALIKPTWSAGRRAADDPRIEESPRRWRSTSSPTRPRCPP